MPKRSDANERKGRRQRSGNGRGAALRSDWLKDLKETLLELLAMRFGRPYRKACAAIKTEKSEERAREWLKKLAFAQSIEDLGTR